MDENYEAFVLLIFLPVLLFSLWQKSSSPQNLTIVVALAFVLEVVVSMYFVSLLFYA